MQCNHKMIFSFLAFMWFRPLFHVNETFIYKWILFFNVMKYLRLKITIQFSDYVTKATWVWNWNFLLGSIHSFEHFNVEAYNSSKATISCKFVKECFSNKFNWNSSYENYVCGRYQFWIAKFCVSKILHS